MNKYRARKTEVAGIVFDSKKEARRYGELLLLQRAGEIRRLFRQVKYELAINGVKICDYRADFVYADARTEKPVVEDVKSEITRKLPVYRMKKKLMKAIMGIDILET